jgi:hypothetical protein
LGPILPPAAEKGSENGQGVGFQAEPSGSFLKTSWSIVVHVAAVAALAVVPLVATDVLPEPWRAVEYITVVPPPIEPPPPPVQRQTAPPQPAQVSSVFSLR